MRPIQLHGGGFLALIVTLSGGWAHAAEEWVPKDTYAVIAGVLKWEDRAITSFSDRNRKDRELRDVLVERGVPARNVALLLDNQATLAAIRRELRAVAERATPDATLIFYYCGHGGPETGRGVCFLNYDCGNGKPTLAVSEVAAIVKQAFKGRRVLLMADCCHSGGLKAVAAELGRGGIRAASLTSADATNASTGNWTFTQAVLDSLRGAALVDRDGDGVVTLGEAVREVADAMKYREAQRHGHAFHGVGPQFRLGPATASAPTNRPSAGGFRLGDYVLAPDGGKKSPARLVGWDGGRFAVEFYDYSDKRVVHLAADRLERITYKTYPVGKQVRVLWEEKPYPAKILAVEDDFHLITYAGYGKEWDEWVLANRILPENQRVVQVKWEGKWYPAVVLESKGNRHRVHYLDYDSSWDEWVGPDRIRFPKGPNR